MKGKGPFDEAIRKIEAARRQIALNDRWLYLTPLSDGDRVAVHVKAVAMVTTEAEQTVVYVGDWNRIVVRESFEDVLSMLAGDATMRDAMRLHRLVAHGVGEKDLLALLPMFTEVDVRAAIEAGRAGALAREIYDGWKDEPGWVPWDEAGNSSKQEAASRAKLAADANEARKLGGALTVSADDGTTVSRHNDGAPIGGLPRALLDPNADDSAEIEALRCAVNEDPGLRARAGELTFDELMDIDPEVNVARIVNAARALVARWDGLDTRDRLDNQDES